MLAANVTLPRRLHRKAKAESMEDCTECVESRIPLLGQGAIQRFAAQSCLLGERSHSTECIRNGAQRDRHRARIAVLKHRFDIERNIGLRP